MNNAPKLIATVITAAALAATPAVAAAASPGPSQAGSCPAYWCGDGNHNEVLVST